MNQLKKIALATSVALAFGIVTNTDSKGATNSARAKTERKAMQNMQLLAKSVT